MMPMRVASSPTWVTRGGDTVMNYNDGPHADCSPHPLDILAIYALYQTVSP